MHGNELARKEMYVSQEAHLLSAVRLGPHTVWNILDTCGVTGQQAWMAAPGVIQREGAWT